MLYRGLLAVVLLLLLANVTGLVLKFQFDHDYVYGLAPLFDLDEEWNIPTMISALMLLLCGALLFAIGRMHASQQTAALPWIGLGLIFVFLSLDEVIGFHERIGVALRESQGSWGCSTSPGSFPMALPYW